MINTCKGIALLFPSGKQFVENFCVGFRGGVEQDHCPVMGAGQKLIHGIFPGGLLIVIPVGIGKAPKNCFIAQLLCQLQIFFAVDPLGWPIVFWELIAGNLPEQAFYFR